MRPRGCVQLDDGPLTLTEHKVNVPLCRLVKMMTGGMVRAKQELGWGVTRFFEPNKRSPRGYKAEAKPRGHNFMAV